MASGDDIRYSTLYFGFASNLSANTMRQRCPESAYCGLARLEGYKWIINETGYANIVRSPNDLVYGALFFLTERDEAALDRQGADLLRDDGSVQYVRPTAYIDVQRTAPGTVQPEYVLWCNRAVKDAERDGMPTSYAEKYIRPFVPLREESEAEQSTAMLRLPYVMAGPETTNWAAFGSGLSDLDKRKHTAS